MTRSRRSLVRRELGLGAGLLVALLLGGQASRLAAQQPAPTGLSTAVWQIELAEVERRLAAIEEEARRDPELESLNELLGAELRAAMEAEDPGLHAELERVVSLEEVASTAEAAGDVETLRTLTEQVTRTQRRFEATRAAALRRGDLADRVEVFHAVLRRRMIAEHPETARLLARYRELNALLGGEVVARAR